MNSGWRGHFLISPLYAARNKNSSPKTIGRCSGQGVYAAHDSCLTFHSSRPPPTFDPFDFVANNGKYIVSAQEPLTIALSVGGLGRARVTQPGNALVPGGGEIVAFTTPS